METIDCIKTRQSIRKFKPEPVPRSTLMDLIDTARWSPSYKNTQPWKIIILSGKSKAGVSNLMTQLFKSGQPPTPDLPTPASWPQTEQNRIDQLLAARTEATGTDFNDPETIRNSKIANFNFYDAPHAIYLFQENSLTPWSLFDLGLFAQTFMLTAHDMGLATVPQAFATDYAKEIKEFLKIPVSKRLVLGLSIGFPDKDSPVNAMKTERSKVDDITKWLK